MTLCTVIEVIEVTFGTVMDGEEHLGTKKNGWERIGTEGSVTITVTRQKRTKH